MTTTNDMASNIIINLLNFLRDNYRFKSAERIPLRRYGFQDIPIAFIAVFLPAMAKLNLVTYS